MGLRTNKTLVFDEKQVFDYKTNQWVVKPKLANIGHIINDYICKVRATSPIIRGVKISSIDMERNSYARNDMATTNYKTYDDAIRSLKTPDYEVWKIIKSYIHHENVTVKLNPSLIQQWTGIKDASNANKVIKRLLASKLIIKAERYKDLYGINPNLYFRGNYNKVAIDYINAGYNVEDKTGDKKEVIDDVDWDNYYDDECNTDDTEIKD